MWVDLIRMREAGLKRTNETLKADRPERGRLTLSKARAAEETYVPSELTTVAFFVVRAHDGPFDVRHRLNDARVTRIGDDSFVVAGVEQLFVAGGRPPQSHIQAWWCRIAPEPEVTTSLEQTRPKPGGGPVVDVEAVQAAPTLAGRGD